MHGEEETEDLIPVFCYVLLLVYSSLRPTRATQPQRPGVDRWEVVLKGGEVKRWPENSLYFLLCNQGLA